ncbi:MAG: hypothetical protein AAF716_02875 [Cyanobacteria bacterium P01_D01_bin.1]
MQASQKVSTKVSTVLALVLGFLTLSVGTVLLYSIGIGTAVAGAEAQTITPQLLALRVVFGTCGLGFATLSGYIVGLVAQRAPIAHAAAFSLMLVVVYVASTVWNVGASVRTDQTLVSIFDVAIAPTVALAVTLAITLAGIMTGGWIRYAQMQAARSA